MSSDRIHEAYQGKIFGKSTQRELRQRVHWICCRVTGVRVFDVGCSQGTVSLILARNGLDVTGVDLNSEALEFARKLAAQEPEDVRQRLTLIGGNALDHFQDSAYDCVILGQVIEHVPDADRILSMAHKALKEEGTVIVTTPFGYHPRQDHLQTYFLSDFLPLVSRHFELMDLEIVGQRICYRGRKAKKPSKTGVEDTPLGWEKSLLMEEAEFFRIQQKYHDEMDRWIEIRDELNKRLEEKGTRESNFRRKIEALQKDMADLERTLQRETRGKDVLKEKAAWLTERVDQLERERDEANAKAARLSGRMQRLGKKLVRYRADKISLAKQLETAGSWEKSLSERVIRYEASLGQQRDRIEALVAQLSQARNELIQTQEGLSHSSAEWQWLRSIVDRLEDQDTSTEESDRTPPARSAGGRTASTSGSRERTESAALDPKQLQRQLEEEQGRLVRARQEVNMLRNSIRFKLGSYVAEACKSPRETLRLPGRVLKLAASKWKDARGREKGEEAPRHKPLGPPIGVILDEFSMSCFEPEGNLLTFRPDNWKKQLEENPCQFLFVESAWRGNDGAWQYRIASYARNIGDELEDLLAYCRSRQIPTVFWNKEDPVHFDRFIGSAKLFQHVFTSDERCLPQYKEATGHDQIYALPFAAQTQLHNPVLEQRRELAVCFAGTYYASRHEQRRADMDYLLRPALDYDLHIYDRRFGHVGRDADQFRFPEIYRPAIQGRLEYDEMVKAYKKYRVFLNVNSVKDSKTMFSRRVFELLACGTPVISTYSKGIEAILGDTVFFSESEDDTRRHLERLLNDDEAWMKASVRGIRRVMDGNTYRDRFADITRRLGLERRKSEAAKLQVVAVCRDAQDVQQLRTSLERQSYQGLGISLLKKGEVPSSLQKSLDKLTPNGGVSDYPYSEVGLRGLLKDLEEGAASHVAVFSADCLYGKHYLEDYRHALLYAPGHMLGRHTYYKWHGSGAPRAENQGFEFCITSGAPCASMVVAVDALNLDLVKKLLGFKWYRSSRPGIFSLHRFGYMETSKRVNASETPDHVRNLLDV